MRIDYIEFKNFASYGNQKQRIDFVKDGSELFLTLGKNGDGKTTIANAIIYALYGKVEGVKLADLPNRINKELLVKIGLQCGTMFIEIERGIAPSRFNVLINGVEFDKAGKKSVQEYLEDEVFGIPYHVFKNIIILSVNDFKSFLTSIYNLINLYIINNCPDISTFFVYIWSSVPIIYNTKRYHVIFYKLLLFII